MKPNNALVGCAGILVSDTFCGPMADLPREGQLLAVDSLPTKAGGCAANVAIDLAKQGIPVDVCGCLGKDPSANVLLASLQAHGVNCERIVYSEALPTSKTVILLVAGQDRRYIHSFGANADFKVAHIDRNWIRSLDIFYLGGLFLMPSFDPAEFQELLLFCRANQVRTVVDVVIPQDASLPENLHALFSTLDYFLPNEDEARVLTGESDPVEQLKRLLALGADTVMVTRGSQGVLAGSDGQSWQTGVYHNIQTLDPSGSGDAFAAGVIAALLQGKDMPDVIRYASALGASANRALGTTDGVFTAQEAEQFILENPLQIRSQGI